MDKIAHIDLSNLWGGERSPILYRDLKDFNVDPDELTWLPVTPPKPAEPVGDFSIDAVRASIAKHYQVPVEHVSISIRL